VWVKAKLSFDVKADGTHINQNSSYAIATGYGMDDESSISGKGGDFSRTVPDFTWLLVSGYLKHFSRVIAAAGNRRPIIFL
jgi:hypothetical protein